MPRYGNPGVWGTAGKPARAPKKKPAPRRSAPGSPASPFDSAMQSVDQMIAAMLAQVEREQATARQQAEMEAQRKLAEGQALAYGLQQLGISGAVQSAFQNAAQAQAGLAQGFSGATRDAASAAAADQARQLSGTGQEGAVRNQGEAMGNVTYGLGYIPATQLNQTGAAFGAQAALQPGFAVQFGQLAKAEREREFADELMKFADQKAEVIGKRPELAMDMLSKLNKPSSSSKATIRQLANGQLQAFGPDGRPVGKPYGPTKTVKAAKQPNLQARSLSNGQVQWFDPQTGQPVGKPVGPPRAAAKKAASKGYNLQFKKFDGYGQWFDPRTGKPVGGRVAAPRSGGASGGRSDGLSASKVQQLREDAFLSARDGIKGYEENGVVYPPKKPVDVLNDLLDAAIPFDIAVRAVARFFPPAKKWYGNSPKTAQNAAANPIAKDALEHGPQSGARYVFGAEAPGRAFDCSGYTKFMVKRHAGVDLPHQARAQFYDPRGKSVPTPALQPGDVVFFRSSRNGQGDGPPYHCGYYIGGGKYVEYYSSGKPARVSSLSSRQDYMGARRFG